MDSLKERVTITIDKELMRRIDQRVDKKNIKSRSHAIELMLRNAVRGKVPTRALILAAGRDEMAPLTNTTPKAMLRVQDKPLIAHNLELLARHGVKEVIIHIGHLGKQIKEFVGDGSTWGLEVSYSEELPDEPLGTAGPIRALREFTESLLVLNADELKDVDLERMFAAHLANGGICTIALTTVPDVSKYGAALLEGNRIIRFVEKPAPDAEATKLINAGVYIFEPAVRDYIPEGFALLATDVLPKLAREEQLFGHPFAGQWLCPETPDELASVEQEWRGFRQLR